MKGVALGALVVFGLITGLVLAVGCTAGVTYNNLVGKENSVDEAWGNVENQYQRRADLVPNLVETVKGIAEQERVVFEEVTRLRSQVGQVTVDPSNQGQMAEFATLQDQLGSAIARLLLVVERYPEIRSQQNFLELQAQLEGTENRIAVARRDYNSAVKNYNNAVRKFPGNIFAGMFGFDTRPFFEAKEGADQPPKIDFSIPEK